ncbi:uncharacterized protein IL334_001892 [Kwoniella shivajii]|uniref:Zn(2)-C6 fungal-type domain-containing protein n=1 Tax=Kwoniella shivajii TaxID=564305 RepID=A0ABZ1CTF1_9TREE|nr:hypothetical protein IL334_001892 [Kwoniella shivajii]
MTAVDIPSTASGSENPAIGEDQSDGREKKRTRSRNGCLVCRSRRLKCDLDKPECQRCVNYGAECVYPEKKAFNHSIVAEKLSKRHKSKRENGDNPKDEPPNILSSYNTTNSLQLIDPSSSKPIHETEPSQYQHQNQHQHQNQTQVIQHIQHNHSQPTMAFLPQPLTPLSTPLPVPTPSSTGQTLWVPHPTPLVQQMDAVELLMALCRDTRMGQFFGGPLDPPEFLRKMFPVEEDLRCFHHALTYSLSILVVEEEPNPWVDHVARLFLVPTGETPLSSEALKQGILAMGAIHLSVLEARGSVASSSGRTRELGLAYRWEAVKLLRQAKDIPKEIESDAFLASTVILSCDDVLGANPHWREVIRLGLLSVKARGGCERILYPDDPIPGADPIISPILNQANKPVSPLLRCLIETLVITDVGCSLSTGDLTVVLTDSSTWWERLAPADPNESDSIESTWGMHRSIPRLMTRTLNLVCESRDLDRQSFFDSDGDETIIHTSGLALLWVEEKTRWRQNLKLKINELRRDMEEWIINIPSTLKRKRTHDGSLAAWHGFQILILKDLMRLPRSNIDIQKSADTVLDICSQVGDKVEWMNFSLLITCTALISPLQRQRAREVLRWFRVQSCYEIDVLESVAEECWKRIDDGLDDEACSWREILLEMGCSVLLG